MSFSYHSILLSSSSSNSIPLMNWVSRQFTSGLSQRCLYHTSPCTLVQNSLLPILENLTGLYDMNPTSVPYANDDLEWVDASTPTLILFYISVLLLVTNCNLNDQLANTFFWLSENLNQGSLKPSKPWQLKTYIPNTFNGSDLHKLNHFLFKCQHYF